MDNPYNLTNSNTPSKMLSVRRESVLVPPQRLMRDNSVQQLEALEVKDYQPDLPYLNKNMQINIPISKVTKGEIKHSQSF
jgi:hypothetical protein